MAVVTRAPDVKLGQTVSNGIAPSMFALLDRGVRQRPDLAAQLRGKVAIRFKEGFSPVRITFGPRVIRVEDGDLPRADLTVSGNLAHIVQLTVTPMRMGLIPNVLDSRGRTALLRVATGRVRLSGDLVFARRLLEMMAVPPPEGPHRRRPRARRPARRDEAVWIDVLT